MEKEKSATCKRDISVTAQRNKNSGIIIILDCDIENAILSTS